MLFRQRRWQFYALFICYPKNKKCWCASGTANTCIYIEIRFSFEAELAKKKGELSFYGFNENESFRMVICFPAREARGGGETRTRETFELIWLCLWTRFGIVRLSDASHTVWRNNVTGLLFRIRAEREERGRETNRETEEQWPQRWIAPDKEHRCGRLATNLRMEIR